MKDRKVVLYIGVSLDGYIATKDDSLEWLLNTQGCGDNGFGAFYDSVETIIMGKRTYDWIMEQENGRFPYIGKECYVYSTRRMDDTAYVKFTSQSPEKLFAGLKKECTRRKKYETIEDVKRDMFEYIELFYNRKRLHSTLGYMSPVAYRLAFMQ